MCSSPTFQASVLTLVAAAICIVAAIAVNRKPPRWDKGEHSDWQTMFTHLDGSDFDWGRMFMHVDGGRILIGQ